MISEYRKKQSKIESARFNLEKYKNQSNFLYNLFEKNEVER
jgi:hypothetical protein